MIDLTPYRTALRRLTRTDPDPRVRHRADALMLVADGQTLSAAARTVQTSAGRLRAWRDRFLAEGRDGLADRPRCGRSPKLDAAARHLLATVLAQSPLDHGYPVTIWTVADLWDLLGRHGYAVNPATVNRALHAMGYRYRRPRHDLTHRQDAEAVASAKHALAELQKRGRLPGRASGFSTWMSATSTLTPTWQRSGSAAASR
ncbi:MAG: helix-turn-helix domain-containing protein [Thermomicrobiales bacterium]